MIFRNIIFSAVLVGLVSGLVYGVFQQTQLSPIIYAAEKFEVESAVTEEADTNHSQQHSHAHLNSASSNEWAPEDGAERIFWTMLANVLTGISFALVMLSLMALHDLKSNKPEVDSLQGIAWGVAALFAIFVAPVLAGLHPEVPGSLSAGLELRQSLWLFSVLLTAIAIAVLYYMPVKFKALGIVIGAVPYLLASQVLSKAQTGFVNNDPVAVAQLSELSQQFLSMTAIGTAIFFILLGASSGFAVKRFIKLNAKSV